MRTFQEEITHHWDDQKEILQNSGFKIHFRAKMINSSLAILVENDSALLPQELDRIKKESSPLKNTTTFPMRLWIFPILKKVPDLV